MGTWGTDAFANDDAMDWIGDLTAVKDSSVLHASFEATNGSGGEIEAPAGSAALAAAEVVAALRGRPSVSLPNEVAAWVAAHGPSMEVDLLDKALRAVRLVGEDGERSELKQLWDEAADDDAQEWRDHITDLLLRLS